MKIWWLVSAHQPGGDPQVAPVQKLPKFDPSIACASARSSAKTRVWPDGPISVRSTLKMWARANYTVCVQLCQVEKLQFLTLNWENRTKLCDPQHNSTWINKWQEFFITKKPRNLHSWAWVSHM